MDCTASVGCFRQYSHFHNIDSSKPGTWYIYPSVCVIFHFFHQCLIVFCIQVFGLFVVVCYSVAKLCPTLWDPMNWSTPGFPVLHYLPEFAQTHVHWVSDAIQSSHPLSPPSSVALNLCQYQGSLQRVGSLHQVARLLELHLQHQSFQQIFKVDFL